MEKIEETKLKLANDISFGLNFIADNQTEKLIPILKQKFQDETISDANDVFVKLKSLYENDKTGFIEIVKNLDYDRNAQNYTGGFDVPMTQQKSAGLWGGILTIVGAVAGGLGNYLTTTGTGAGTGLTPEEIQRLEEEAKRKEEEEKRKRMITNIIVAVIIAALIAVIIYAVVNKKKTSK